MAKNCFVGTWRLVKSEFQRKDGATIYPFGKDAEGLLIYDEQNHMSVQIMQVGRSLFASGDRLIGSLEEIKAAFDGYLAYFGEYKVNTENHTINHQIKASLFPNWVGREQIRLFEFSGDCLTLKTLLTPTAGPTTTGILIWERVA